MLLVALVLMIRSALAPHWDSRINSAQYVAYSDGTQLIFCARGLIGHGSLNPFVRINQQFMTDQAVSECAYLEFESAPAPGIYSLTGTGHAVTSGTGERHDFTPRETSSLKALWFERTCFCRTDDVPVQFEGTLDLRSLKPLSGNLELSFMSKGEAVEIDARLSSFDAEPLAELRRRETRQRMLTR